MATVVRHTVGNVVAATRARRADSGNAAAYSVTVPRARVASMRGFVAEEGRQAASAESMYRSGLIRGSQSPMRRP